MAINELADLGNIQRGAYDTLPLRVAGIINVADSTHSYNWLPKQKNRVDSSRQRDVTSCRSSLQMEKK